MPTNHPHLGNVFVDGACRSERSLSSNPIGFPALSATHLIHHRCRLVFEMPALKTGRSAIGPPGRSGLDAGWLIAAESVDAWDVTNSRTNSFRYLQIATGQWCSPAHATWFPVRSAAILYASDLGSDVARSIEVIYLRRDRRSNPSVW
jgi:hypothetical protein